MNWCILQKEIPVKLIVSMEQTIEKVEATEEDSGKESRPKMREWLKIEL